MKIYCSRQISDIDKYIGKDVWVKMYSRGFNKEFYRKFIRTYVDENSITQLVYREFPAEEFELYNKSKLGYLDTVHFNHHKYDYKYEVRWGLEAFLKSNFFIQPKEIITDEEFFDIINKITEECLS